MPIEEDELARTSGADAQREAWRAILWFPSSKYTGSPVFGTGERWMSACVRRAWSAISSPSGKHLGNATLRPDASHCLNDMGSMPVLVEIKP